MKTSPKFGPVILGVRELWYVQVNIVILLNVVLYYATEFMIHYLLYYVNHVFYSMVTSGILDILGVTIEKNTQFMGSHEHIIVNPYIPSMTAALLLPGLRDQI